MIIRLTVFSEDFFPREDDVNSTGSASSFFGLDDKNNNFLSDQDDFLSPYDWSLPDSPSMDELSLNFRKLRRPSKYRYFKILYIHFRSFLLWLFRSCFSYIIL